MNQKKDFFSITPNSPQTSLLNVHTTLVLLKNLHLSTIPSPASLQRNMELRSSNTEHLEQRRLPRIENLSLPANGECLLVTGQLQHNLALDETSGNSQLTQLRLDRVADWLVLRGGDLAGSRVHKAIGDAEGPGADGSGTGEVQGTEGVKVVGDGLGVARGEEETDGTGQIGNELVQVGGCFGFGVVAQCDGHDFGLAEEETAKMLAINPELFMH